MKCFRLLVLGFIFPCLLGGPPSALARGHQQQQNPASSQAPEDAPTCTDLSGKNPEPCPTDAEPPLVSPADGASTAPESGSEPSPKSEPGSAADSASSSSSASSALKPAAVKGPAVPGETAPAAAAEGESRPGSSSENASPMDTVESEEAEGTAKPAQPAGFLSLERTLPRNLLLDQKNFWTSPLRIRVDDVKTLFPFFVVTGLVIGNDRGIESHVPLSWKSRSDKISNYGAAAFAGMVGGGYLWGKIRHNDHLTETGFLAGEAAVSSLGIAEGIKLIAGRDRPLEADQRGNFFDGGQSFPSEHATAAFAIATVVAHEYPGPLTKFLAYGGAAGIAAARVGARQHWTSDVLVGSALGWLVGEQVSHAHIREAADTANWGTFVKSQPEARNPADMGSPYVPIDYWVYPVFDRLAAMGYIQTAFMGLRPWTRMECARLVEEAGQSLGADDTSPADSEADKLYDALRQEFAPELARRAGARNLEAEIESVYSRFTQISGTPLTDGYHFGQTIINDYGRPYSEGANVVTGLTARATAGPLAFYVRGEYQHAPSVPVPSLAVQQMEATVDGIPLQPAQATSQVDRFRLLDAYFALQLRHFEISFGQQSLWWGPGNGGPMLFSDNAEPIPMVRISRTQPIKLPSVFGWLGPVRSEYFIGRLSGYQSVLTFPCGDFNCPRFYGPNITDQPFVQGGKIHFKPTPNLEFGVAVTSVFAGPGFPLTWHTFQRALFSTSGNAAVKGEPGFPNDPGDRRSGFDFSYRIPGLRNWLVLYTDSMAEDEINPIAYPRRSAMNPGIYLPRLPRLPKVDFRVEAVYTDLPNLVPQGFYYYNFHYKDGYTNNGLLLGSWVGREGRGIQANSTVWLSARNKLQVGYRNAYVNKASTNTSFIPGGGEINDFSVRSDWSFRSNLSVQTFLQYEHWNFPVLALRPQTDVTGSIQLIYWPHWGAKPQP